MPASAPVLTAAPPELSPETDVLDRRAVSHELRFALAQAAAGGCKITVLSGESGSGKTQLAQDLLPLVRQRGGMLIESRVQSPNWSQPLDSLLLGLAQLSPALTQQVCNPSLSGQEAFLDLARRLGLLVNEPNQVDFSLALNIYLLVGELLSYASQQLKPLVWIVDDVDLLDQDTLAVLDYVIAQRATPYLMILLCVRDEHLPAIGRWKENQNCQLLRLSPFSVRDTVAWLIEEQNLNPRLAAEIAPFLQQTCQGNLQLCRFLLDSLAAHDLLGAVPDAQWAARIEQIALQLRAPEAETFFRARLMALPETGLEILQSACLIGMEFDTRFLHDFLPLAAVREHLDVARQANLIEVLSEDAWRFVHPHLVRLTAETITQQGELHARLAQRMLKQPNFALPALRHAQQAGEILLFSDRVQFAEQSLQIAQQLFHQGNPLLAGQILEQILALVGARVWSELVPLSENLIEVWCATLQEASQLADLQAIQRCVPETASPKVLFTLAASHMRLAMVAHDFERAFLAAEVALDVLQEPLSMQGEVGQILLLLLQWLGRKYTRPACATPCEDSRVNHAQAILADLFGPCFFSRPQLLIAVTLKQLIITHRAGISPSSASGAIYAAMILASLGFQDLAMQFATQAQQQAQTLQDRQRHRVPILDFAFVQPWRSNLQQLLPDIWRWQHNAYAQGDFEFAGYASVIYLGHSILNGSPLGHLAKEAAKVDEDLRLTRQQHLLPLCASFQQFLAQSTQISEVPPWLGTGRYISEQQLNDLAQRDDAFNLFNFHLCHAYAATLCHAPLGAEQHLVAAQAYKRAVQGSIIAALFDFMLALNVCAQVAPPRWRQRRATRKTLSRFQRWASDNPSLFGCKYALLQAEWCHSQQQFEQAQHYYLQAIESARTHHHHHEYGMAALYYARFLLGELQFHHARQMFRLAIEQYEAWGALGFAAYIRHEYGEFINKSKI